MKEFIWQNAVIQSPIQKLYEITLAQELKRLNGKTSPRQFGFKPHMSTSNATLGFYTFIRNLPTPARGCQGILLVDFAKAYDSVNRDRLYQTIHEAGMDADTLYKINAIHSNSKVVINNVSTTLRTRVHRARYYPHTYSIFLLTP